MGFINASRAKEISNDSLTYKVESFVNNNLDKIEANEYIVNSNVIKGTCNNYKIEFNISW